MAVGGGGGGAGGGGSGSSRSSSVYAAAVGKTAIFKRDQINFTEAVT